jgi:hypothetical protein
VEAREDYAERAAADCRQITHRLRNRNQSRYKNERRGKKSDGDGVVATNRLLIGVKQDNLLGCSIRLRE